MTLSNPVIMEELLNFDALDAFTAAQMDHQASFDAIQTMISQDIIQQDDERKQPV
ncbi:hypothetical protein [Aestuariispira insulae]|uniref:Uncharacterized protein n=1 Tax=Aestuariispira insulae TaxID=1461337 RepID=A0A3D9HPV5_9PROT|nr:hypothetical protein [Aestuariispira insulae]RED51544.1 hypothetical protein DFP90_103347 [Aestuariispira insulae]